VSFLSVILFSPYEHFVLHRFQNILHWFIENGKTDYTFLEVDAAKEAGELIHNLPVLWQEATSTEQ
jgi:hypothetical protein